MGAGLLVTALAGRALLRAPAATTAGGAGAVPRDPRATTGRTRLLITAFGLITLCTAYGEGALADWGSLHLAQDLGAGPGLAAAGYAGFALTMTLSRAAGTWLLERLGTTPVLVTGAATAAVGMLWGALSAQTWLVFAGYALTGLGLANVFPIAVGSAGALGGSSGVAAASALGYSGILLGPPSIGFLTEAFGLPAALTTIAALAGLAALLGCAVHRVGKPQRRPGRRPPNSSP
ncbi:MFS transporter [Streptomyces noursei]|uniref:MFS transporter n=1 Tax=Streptomyces noursei TaxID=1971 RepID=UPI0037FFF3E3